MHTGHMIFSSNHSDGIDDLMSVQFEEPPRGRGEITRLIKWLHHQRDRFRSGEVDPDPKWERQIDRLIFAKNDEEFMRVLNEEGILVDWTGEEDDEPITPEVVDESKPITPEVVPDLPPVDADEDDNPYKSPTQYAEGRDLYFAVHDRLDRLKAKQRHGLELAPREQEELDKLTKALRYTHEGPGGYAGEQSPEEFEQTMQELFGDGYPSEEPITPEVVPELPPLDEDDNPYKSPTQYGREDEGLILRRGPSGVRRWMKAGGQGQQSRQSGRFRELAGRSGGGQAHHPSGGGKGKKAPRKRKGRHRQKHQSPVQKASRKSGGDRETTAPRVVGSRSVGQEGQYGATIELPTTWDGPRSGKFLTFLATEGLDYGITGVYTIRTKKKILIVITIEFGKDNKTRAHDALHAAWQGFLHPGSRPATSGSRAIGKAEKKRKPGPDRPVPSDGPTDEEMMEGTELFAIQFFDADTGRWKTPGPINPARPARQAKLPQNPRLGDLQDWATGSDAGEWDTADKFLSESMPLPPGISQADLPQEEDPDGLLNTLVVGTRMAMDGDESMRSENDRAIALLKQFGYSEADIVEMVRQRIMEDQFAMDRQFTHQIFAALQFAVPEFEEEKWLTGESGYDEASVAPAWLMERISELLEKNRTEGLTEAEEDEWERYAAIEHKARMAKAKQFDTYEPEDPADFGEEEWLEETPEDRLTERASEYHRRQKRRRKHPFPGGYGHDDEYGHDDLDLNYEDFYDEYEASVQMAGDEGEPPEWYDESKLRKAAFAPGYTGWVVDQGGGKARLANSPMLGEHGPEWGDEVFLIEPDDPDDFEGKNNRRHELIDKDRERSPEEEAEFEHLQHGGLPDPPYGATGQARIMVPPVMIGHDDELPEIELPEGYDDDDERDDDEFAEWIANRRRPVRPTPRQRGA